MRIKKHALRQTLLITVIFMRFSVVNSAEIQSFGYLGYEGRLNLDSLYEENVTGVENKDSYTEERKINRGSLDLLFRTFIYHPNFLKFDFGIGVVYTDASNKTSEIIETPPSSGNYIPKEPVRISADDTSLDYSFNLSFFESKDYPFSLFYSLVHPPLSSAVEGAFISKNTRYGAKFTWNAPIIINLDAIHFDSKGSSNLRIIDEVSDSTSLRAYKALRNGGYHQLVYTHQITSSNSGSTQEPLVVYKNTGDNLNYDNMVTFGDKQQYELRLRANYESNRDAFEFDEYGVNGDFQWTHNAFLRSYYSYGHVTTEYADYNVLNDYARGGLAYTKMGITNTTDMLADRSKFPDSETKQLDLRNTTGYTKRFRGGNFALNGTLAVIRNESISDVAAQEVKENITLIEGQYVYFTQPNILTNQPIEVRDLKSNQLYVEGIHYILIRQNGTVGIQQNNPGFEHNLKPNSTVSVTYFFNPSNNNTQTKSGVLTAQLTFLNYFHTTAYYSENKLDLLEGTLAQSQVLERTRTYYTASIDIPIIPDLILGGIEYTNGNIDELSEQNLTITKGESGQVYLQFRLFRSTSLYLSRKDITTDIIGAIGDNNDVDKITYHALLKIQPSVRTNMFLTYDDSVDIGTIERKYSEASLRFEWRYRRLLINLTGTYYKDRQNTRIRDRNAVHLNLIRTF